MPLFRRSPGAIEWADLEAFIQGRVPENVMLDYKEDRDTLTDNILKTIGAMANTYGGDILVGIAEQKDGTPAPLEKLRGVPVSEFDRHKQQIEQWNLRIQPPVLGLSVESVPIPRGTGHATDDGSCVIVVRVHQSELVPHFIPGKGHYGRAGSHNRPYKDEQLATERIVWLNNRREAHVRFRDELVSMIDKLGSQVPVAWHTSWCVPVFPSPDAPLWERLPCQELEDSIPYVNAPHPRRFFGFDVSDGADVRAIQHGWLWESRGTVSAKWERNDPSGAYEKGSPFATYLVEDHGLVACRGMAEGEVVASTKPGERPEFDRVLFDWDTIHMRFLGVCWHAERLYRMHGYTGPVQIGLELALSPRSCRRDVLLGTRPFLAYKGAVGLRDPVTAISGGEAMTAFDRRLREVRMCRTDELQEAAKQFAVDSFWTRAFSIVDHAAPDEMKEHVERIWSWLRQ